MSDAGSLHPSLLYHATNTLGWRALHPLQEESVRPLLEGRDALLVAPTAGGKTEAALFPLLTAMASEHWGVGPSLLYVCPLRALLNNIEPRVATYTGWVGRRSALWHGDISATARRRIAADWPDVLLTTPESIESMLISAALNARAAFSRVRAVIVDEVHAFAGDDRGWHLLAVLERITRLSERPLQRVGLSATVGNPEDLLGWLQGSRRNPRHGVVIAPVLDGRRPQPEVQVDHVGTMDNAATVLAALYRGEKRLVFCDSRRRVETLTAALRARGVDTFASHASLSVDERRRSERAFSESRDCVIVATSTLELGVDVGDLDRVIQIDAPATVASFQQRLGRTGRRSAAPSNCLFLTTDGEELLQVMGLLRLWETGWVEPVHAPPLPWHILAQQLLALVLQEGRIGRQTWSQWLGELDLGMAKADAIMEHLVANGFLVEEAGMFSMGLEGERTLGRRHFMELTSVFTTAPEFTVVFGRTDLGTVHPITLASPSSGPRVLSLGGRSWLVTHIDWERHRCYVRASELPGRSFWSGSSRTRHFELCQAMRDVASGEDVRAGVRLSERGATALEEEREALRGVAESGQTVVAPDVRGRRSWWTWAGRRANAVLLAALGGVAEAECGVHDLRVPLAAGISSGDFERALARVRDSALPQPAVTERAVEGLKFSEALPPAIASASLAARLGDAVGAAAVAREMHWWGDS